MTDKPYKVIPCPYRVDMDKDGWGRCTVVNNPEHPCHDSAVGCYIRIAYDLGFDRGQTKRKSDD